MNAVSVATAQDPTTRALEQISDMGRQVEVAIAAVARNSLVDFENSLWHQEMLCETLKRSVLLLRDSVQNDEARARLSDALTALYKLNRTYESLMLQSSHTAAVLHDLCARYSGQCRLRSCVKPARSSVRCNDVGLNGSLSIAENALSAQKGGLATTNNNISNVNTPGYSREVVSLTSQALVDGNTSIGDGVLYDGYSSVRDNILNLAINSKTSDQASLTAQNASLTQVNQAFSGTTTGIGADMNTLFSALSALSTTPTDTSARQSVLNAAIQLANDFHQGAASLSSAANGGNQLVVSTVAQINQLSKQIATLNVQLAQVESSGQDGGGTGRSARRSDDAACGADRSLGCADGVAADADDSVRVAAGGGCDRRIRCRWLWAATVKRMCSMPRATTSRQSSAAERSAVP